MLKVWCCIKVFQWLFNLKMKKFLTGLIDIIYCTTRNDTCKKVFYRLSLKNVTVLNILHIFFALIGLCKCLFICSNFYWDLKCCVQYLVYNISEPVWKGCCVGLLFGEYNLFPSPR